MTCDDLLRRITETTRFIGSWRFSTPSPARASNPPPYVRR